MFERKTIQVGVAARCLLLWGAVVGFLAMWGGLTAAQITGPEAEGGEIEFERWYAVLIEDQPSGWAHAWVTRSEGVLVTAMRMEMTLARGPMTMVVGVDSRFEETDDGRPIAATTRQDMGTMAITQRMRFQDDGIELVSRQGGMEQRQFFASPREDWLPPVAASRYVEKQLANGAKRISFRTIDPSTGPQTIEMKINVRGETQVEVMGGKVPAIQWDVETSQLPGVSMTEFVDAQGRAIRTHVAAMPGMTITLVQKDKAEAMAPPPRSAHSPTDDGVAPASAERASGESHSAGGAPDVMVHTFVTPDRPLPAARALRQASYRLRFQAGPEEDHLRAPALPRGGYQRVAWLDDQTAAVVVNLDEPVNPGDDLPGPEHRRASLSLNYRDKVVMDVLREALGSEALGSEARRLSAVPRAEHLRQFVHGFITRKDLSTANATASEVARSRQGDCTEHAVLLAALLRGSGIPSRTVSGLVYVDRFLDHEDVFGYHMWTQAWLADGVRGGGQADAGGRWVDLDATLAHGPFDASHIALMVSAQDEAATFHDLAKMLPWLGRLSIEIIEPAAGVLWQDH